MSSPPRWPDDGRLVGHEWLNEMAGDMGQHPYYGLVRIWRLNSGSA